MFRVELLPAAYGDAIWIEYGDPKKPWRIVIDGGPAPSYEDGLRKRILAVPEGFRHIDLFVVTHIDCDHIDGAILLLREATALKVTFGEVWFNAWDQLTHVAPDVYQPIQGEFFNALLAGSAMRDKLNERVRGEAIYLADDGPLPSWELDGGSRLTLLSPGLKQITRLRARWQSAIREFNPGDSAEALRRLESRREYRPPSFPPVFGVRTPGDDRSVANGSSIAFVLEYEGASCLLASDAHPRVLAASLRRLAQTVGRGRPVVLDAVKVPHHGSIRNISEELITAIDSPVWLISTNGDFFDHPDRDTAALIARHATRPPTFLCNYKSASTMALAARKGEAWQTEYPGERVQRGATGGIAIDLTKTPPRASTPKRTGTSVARARGARGPRRRKR